MATVTGVSRMLNNKHWLSDVLVGAGIGILSVELGYLFADLIFKDKGLTEFEQDFFYDRYCRPSFFGMEVSTEVVMGRYRPVSGVVAEFNAGVNLGIEGAWFMNPYVGFGGRTACLLYTSWREYVESFGFGRKLDSDFLGEGNGYVPDRKFYDRRYRKSWNALTVLSLSIGQGELECTPLQMANLAAIVANRG